MGHNMNCSKYIAKKVCTLPCTQITHKLKLLWEKLPNCFKGCLKKKKKKEPRNLNLDFQWAC